MHSRLTPHLAAAAVLLTHSGQLWRTAGHTAQAGTAAFRATLASVCAAIPGDENKGIRTTSTHS